MACWRYSLLAFDNRVAMFMFSIWVGSQLALKHRIGTLTSIVTFKLVGVTAEYGGLGVTWMDGVWRSHVLSVAVSEMES